MELDFIRWVRSRAAMQSGVQVGIGDDAAVLQMPASGQIAVTTDMLMQGVDFETVAGNARRIGRKSLAVNLSDLAAMAARPQSAFVAVALPRENARALAEDLYGGIFSLANEFAVSIAGGDTNTWDGPLVVCITAIGEIGSKGPLLRSGARPGDEILVTGEFGGSILGRHLDFTPRVHEALWLHERFTLHASIDVSDGLTLDLSRLAEASACGALIDISQVPISADAERLVQVRADGSSALDHALSDGEDFELILAVPPEEAEKLMRADQLPVRLTRIGRFIDRPGLWQSGPGGVVQPLVARGYQHGGT